MQITKIFTLSSMIWNLFASCYLPLGSSAKDISLAKIPTGSHDVGDGSAAHRHRRKEPCPAEESSENSKNIKGDHKAY